MDASVLLADTWAVTIVVGSVLAALVVTFLFERVVLRITARTNTEIDDLIAHHLRLPVAGTVVLGGTWYAIGTLALPEPIPWFTRGVLMSLAVGLWSVAASRIALGVLEWLSKRAEKTSLVSPRTLPVFDFAARVFIWGGAIYFLFLSWSIDVTAWLASAGIVGIAVGFAAKDSLANLFAGVFILADAPYKIGDYLVLDSGERGRVTEIGIRATRILTRDEVQVIVPNAVMANALIYNQSSPSERFRVRTSVDIAYGSDIDQVRQVLSAVPLGVPGVEPRTATAVRFRELGASGLKFEVLFWIERPELRGAVIDEVNTRIYKRLAEAGIEIPYSKHDVYVHQADGPEA